MSENLSMQVETPLTLLEFLKMCGNHVSIAGHGKILMELKRWDKIYDSACNYGVIHFIRTSGRYWSKVLSTVMLWQVILATQTYSSVVCLSISLCINGYHMCTFLILADVLAKCTHARVVLPTEQEFWLTL